MKVFSKRNNIIPNYLEKNKISKTLNIRLLNTFIVYVQNNIIDWGIITAIEEVMTELGFEYEIPTFKMQNDANILRLRKYYADITKIQWSEIYDFIEKSLFVSKSNELESEYNRILNEEGAPYRIIHGLVVPIINDEEIESIQNASATKFESVNKHIEKALELLQNRTNPDYENSIKESISAVESLCSIIAETDGKNNTLGNTLDLIDEKGIRIHTALKEAFKKIYGYASDEKGIRHAGAIEKDAKREDAIYMLVSCSAFVNYLIEKSEEKCD